jgi:thiol:disulfide interchange protein DsbD
MIARNRSPFAALALLVVALASSARAQSLKGVIGEAPEVPALTTALIADTTAVQAGKPFRIGVRFQPSPPWHFYWRHAGEVAQSTAITLIAPPGFKAGEWQWPLPAGHLSFGTFYNYSYGSETLVFAEITPPATLPAGELKFAAVVRAQSCDPTTCKDTNSRPELTLTAGDAAPANREVFEKAAASMPKLDKPPFEVTWSATPTELKVTIAGVPEGTSAEFFPLPGRADVETGEPKVSGEAGRRSITIPIKKGGAPDLAWSGVVATQKDGGPREGWAIGAPPATTPVASVNAPTTGPAQPPLGFRALLAALGSAFLGGVLLNLMPCVLPVIGLKIYGFIRQAGEEPQRVFRLGLAFCAGVMVFFLTMAVLVVAFAAAGHTLNYGEQFQNPYVLVAILAIVFVFGLSLLGVFELGIGSSAENTLGELAQREGYGGAFLHGLLTTLLGTACIGPLLGPVLAIAFLRPGVLTFLVLGVMGLGMAMPYAVLTAKPAWMKFLPRPGAWMERLKQLMGFMMLAIVVALLWLLGKNAGAIIAACALLLVLGFAAWLRGVWSRSAWSWLVALAIGAGGWMVLIAGRLDAPPDASGAVVMESKDGISWQPSSRERVNQAIANGQPVFLDFTADWCVNCKVNERVVLDTEPIRAAFKARNVLLVKVDFTQKNQMVAEWLHEYGRVGVPVYVIYDGKSPEPNILAAQILTQASLLEEIAKIKS